MKLVNIAIHKNQGSIHILKQQNLILNDIAKICFFKMTLEKQTSMTNWLTQLWLESFIRHETKPYEITSWLFIFVYDFLKNKKSQQVQKTTQKQLY